MCLTIPGRIRSIREDVPGDRTAEIDYGDQRRTAHLLYLPEARVGDYVVVQAGFAVSKLEEREALEALRYIAEMNRPSPDARPPPTTMET